MVSIIIFSLLAIVVLVNTYKYVRRNYLAKKEKQMFTDLVLSAILNDPEKKKILYSGTGTIDLDGTEHKVLSGRAIIQKYNCPKEDRS